MTFWYDYRLVVLSILVAIIASHQALAITSRIRDHIAKPAIWLGSGAAAMGLGIWAMHFIGMLAYHLPIVVGYNVVLTMLSLLLAMLASAFALYTIFSSEKLDLVTNVVGALLMGAGIAGMHYVGIYAMEMSPKIQFDLLLVVSSLLIAFAASFLALRFAFATTHSTTLFDSNKSIASIIMGLAIIGVHYTAMAAQHVATDAVSQAAANGINPDALAMIIAIGVLVVVVVTSIVLNYDMKLMSGERQYAIRLANQRQESLNEARQIAEELARDYRRSEEFSNELLDTVGVVVAVLNRRGTVVRFNKGAEQVTGFSRDEIIGRPVWEKLIPEAQRADVEKIFGHLLAGQFPNAYINHWNSKQGEPRLISWSNTALLDGEGEVEYVIATGSDITEQQHAQEELRLAAVAFNTNEAIVITDPQGVILRCNKIFSEITGYRAEEVVGKRTSLLKSGEHDEKFYTDMWEKIRQLGYWMGEIWNRRKNGEIYPEWLRITAVRDEEGIISNYVASFSDISALKESEKQLSYLSNFDPPTGLPNKRLFLELLTKHLQYSRHEEEQGILLYMRLGQLRRLNETLGMRVIDEYLLRFKDHVTDLVGEYAILGRLSGGDFALALGGLKGEGDLYSTACQLAESIIDYVNEGEHIGRDDVHPGVYIGIADYGSEVIDASELLQHAITALNRAKQANGGLYHFYSEELRHQAAETYTMEVALRHAVELGELSLHFQPQVNRNGELVGAEALLRWSHEGEQISPAVFIPLAERAGLINELGDFVFSEGLRWIARFAQQGLPPTFATVALNMSARQFGDPDVMERLKSKLVKLRVEPQRLKIEITESVLLDNPDLVINALNEIKSLGIAIALDDFGTGYSSLSYLHKLPLDQVKIDQSFVRDLSVNPVSRSITENIVMMAHKMELDVIAEGVENEAEMVLLTSYGCHNFQGYYFGRPVSGDAFCQLLNEAQSPLGAA